MTAPRFAAVTEGMFRNLKAADQIEIVELASAFFPEIGPGCGKNTTERWRQVRKAKSEFWDRRSAISKTAPKPATSFFGVSATEVNVMLTAMPPLPLWGEHQ